MKKPLPSQELLQSCLTYCPSSGQLTWLERGVDSFNGTEERSAERQAKQFNSRFAGKPALNSIGKNGYRHGCIAHEDYYAHRIIYKLVTGTEPDQIDHADGNRANNSWKNIDSRNQSQNARNRKLSSNNTSGHHGVSFSKRHKLWVASIYAQGKSVHLGWFKTFEEARNARIFAEVQNGYHINHGRPT